MAARAEVDGRPLEHSHGEWVDPSLAAVWRLADEHDALARTIGSPHNTKLTGALMAAEGLVLAAKSTIVQAREAAGLVYAPVAEPEDGD